MNRLFLILMMFAVSVGGCLCANPTSGKKVGVITSLSSEGLICKTNEGILQRGGLSSGSGAIGQQVLFNIQDAYLAEEARKYLESGQEVELTFTRPWFSSACSRENADDVVVSSIKPIGPHQ